MITSSRFLREEVQKSTISDSLVLTVTEIKATITNLDLVAERAGEVVGDPRRAIRLSFFAAAADRRAAVQRAMVKTYRARSN